MYNPILPGLVNFGLRGPNLTLVGPFHFEQIRWLRSPYPVRPADQSRKRVSRFAASRTRSTPSSPKPAVSPSARKAPRITSRGSCCKAESSPRPLRLPKGIEQEGAEQKFYRRQRRELRRIGLSVDSVSSCNNCISSGNRSGHLASPKTLAPDVVLIRGSIPSASSVLKPSQENAKIAEPKLHRSKQSHRSPIRPPFSPLPPVKPALPPARPGFSPENHVGFTR